VSLTKGGAERRAERHGARGALARPRGSGRRDWLGIVLRPQVLIALVLAGTALPYLLTSTARPRVDVALPTLEEAGDPALRAFEMPIVLVGSDGVPRASTVTVESADFEGERYRATLAALREALVEEGLWPDAVPPPAVMTYSVERRRVAVVDVRPGGAVVATVSQEWAVYRSLVETLRSLGADDVVVVVDGAPADTLFGHVALR
jgi:hypothetical protein